MQFPIYRKYFNSKSYFKILSLNEFEEIQIIGNSKQKMQIIAKQFPEMLRIKDMINCKDNMWEVIEEMDYKKVVD